MWEKEKMLVYTIFSFSHKVFSRLLKLKSYGKGLNGKEVLLVMSISGKVFPKLKRKGSRLSNLSTSSKEGSTSSTSSSTDMEDEATDYVFRIVKVFKPENIRKFFFLYLFFFPIKFFMFRIPSTACSGTKYQNPGLSWTIWDVWNI